MLKNSKIDTENLTDAALTASGVSRRRLVRAGLAAAPVMLVLKSQSALATGTAGTGNHMTCSAWASVSAAKGCNSSHTAQHVSATCKGYQDWAQSKDSECDKKFHKKTDGRGVTKYSECVPFEGSDYGDKSLKEICKGDVDSGDDRKDKLAKHCAAMYLNIKVDHNCPLDEATVKTIWNSCKNRGGTWSPVANGNAWDRDDCNEYFDYVCKGKKPANWGNTCA